VVNNSGGKNTVLVLGRRGGETGSVVYKRNSSVKTYIAQDLRGGGRNQEIGDGVCDPLDSSSRGCEGTSGSFGKYSI